ncbi:hypothetical protein Q8A73_008788 [Channa argus]|nr:hypothetical protein Q8A73_008788 [Channa argus]
MASSFVLLLFFVLKGVKGSHIVGGREVAPNSRPYMASLQFQGQHICGGSLGDSGGPLVCNGVAVGVASVTEKFNCDHPDVPNICTNISKHLHWIRKIIHQTKELE